MNDPRQIALKFSVSSFDFNHDTIRNVLEENPQVRRTAPTVRYLICVVPSVQEPCKRFQITINVFDQDDMIEVLPTALEAKKNGGECYMLSNLDKDVEDFFFVLEHHLPTTRHASSMVVAKAALQIAVCALMLKAARNPPK